MTRLLGLLALLALVLGPATVVDAAPGAHRDLPTRDAWLKDVNKAMRGSSAYVRERTASGDIGLAINFDIDNSSVASYYDGDEAGAIPRILGFAQAAQRHGVVLLFNTGRSTLQRERTETQLAAAGYVVTDLCMRRPRERIVHGKQRCRNRFIAEGYTLIANVGNNPTDFTGDGYERAFRLPNYDGQLG